MGFVDRGHGPSSLAPSPCEYLDLRPALLFALTLGGLSS